MLAASYLGDTTTSSYMCHSRKTTHVPSHTPQYPHTHTHTPHVHISLHTSHIHVSPHISHKCTSSHMYPRTHTHVPPHTPSRTSSSPILQGSGLLCGRGRQACIHVLTRGEAYLHNWRPGIHAGNSEFGSDYTQWSFFTKPQSNRSLDLHHVSSSCNRSIEVSYSLYTVISSAVNLVLFTLTGYWKPHIGYWQVNWQCGMLCQLINSKLVSTACSLADLCRLVSEGGDLQERVSS